MLCFKYIKSCAYLCKNHQHNKPSVGHTANLLITQFKNVTGKLGVVSQSLQEAGGEKGICKGN